VEKNLILSKRNKEKIIAAIKDQTLLITSIQKINNLTKINCQEIIIDKIKSLLRKDSKVKYLRIKKTICLEQEDLQVKLIQSQHKI
jgi:hypothetical protein